MSRPVDWEFLWSFRDCLKQHAPDDSQETVNQVIKEEVSNIEHPGAGAIYGAINNIASALSQMGMSDLVENCQQVAEGEVAEWRLKQKEILEKLQSGNVEEAREVFRDSEQRLREIEAETGSVTVPVDAVQQGAREVSKGLENLGKASDMLVSAVDEAERSKMKNERKTLKQSVSAGQYGTAARAAAAGAGMVSKGLQNLRNNLAAGNFQNPGQRGGNGDDQNQSDPGQTNLRMLNRSVTSANTLTEAAEDLRQIGTRSEDLSEQADGQAAGVFEDVAGAVNEAAEILEQAGEEVLEEARKGKSEDPGEIAEASEAVQGILEEVGDTLREAIDAIRDALNSKALEDVVSPGGGDRNTSLDNGETSETDRATETRNRFF